MILIPATSGTSRVDMGACFRAWGREKPALFSSSMTVLSRSSAPSVPPTGWAILPRKNTGDEPLRVLIGFNTGDYQEISLSTWLASNPNALVADNLKTTDAYAEKLPDHRVFIAPKEGAKR